MLRTAGRLLAVTTAAVSTAAALQGTALAGPGETFNLSWAASPGCYGRSVTINVVGADPAEYIQYQLSVTVNGAKTIGAKTTLSPGDTSARTVSVSAPCGSSGQPAVYDLWINGYKGALAAPDYVLDQYHGYSVCNVTAVGACTDMQSGVPVITKTPVA